MHLLFPLWRILQAVGVDDPRVLLRKGVARIFDPGGGPDPPAFVL